MKIIVNQVENYYRASVDGRPDLTSIGHSPAMAIGNLILMNLDHFESLGLQVEIVEDGNEFSTTDDNNHEAALRDALKRY